MKKNKDYNPFEKCESCPNGVCVTSENGIHWNCSLSAKKALKCLSESFKSMSLEKSQADRKMERQLIDGLLYAPQLCGTEQRLNPVYDVGHCFTVMTCNKCGELFEADKEHICRYQNSYPDIGTEKKDD